MHAPDAGKQTTFMRKNRSCSLFFTFLAGSILQSKATSFVAVTWGDDSVHFLDSNMGDTGSFPVGVGLPNGVATDGSLIWVGSFTGSDVIAYNFAGVEQFRWSLPGSFSLQGLDYESGGKLVAIDGAHSTLSYFNAFTGASLGSAPAISDSTEAVAVDGLNVWQLVDSHIYLTKQSDGSTVTTIPNAAKNEFFEGTGMANLGADLMLAAESGNWYRVSKADGSLLQSGNNGLQMYDLQPIPSTTVPDTGGSALALVGVNLAISAYLKARDGKTKLN